MSRVIEKEDGYYIEGTLYLGHVLFPCKACYSKRVVKVNEDKFIEHLGRILYFVEEDLKVDTDGRNMISIITCPNCREETIIFNYDDEERTVS